MVVCRCRKATKLYCFVHKVPVCGECISFPEHKLCVVKTYSDWVIDGDYDWPPKCGLCQEVLQETDDVTRLGCFHLLHSRCLETHLRSFPPHTAPAGYACPSCSLSIWPPKLVRDSGSGLPAKLKEVISKSGLATTLLGSDVNFSSSTDRVPAPPAFSSAPLVSTGSLASSSNPPEDTASGSGAPVPPEVESLGGGQLPSAGEITQSNEAESRRESEPSSSTDQGGSGLKSTTAASHYSKAGPPPLQLHNGSMARKNSIRGDGLSPSSSTLVYDDDEDGGDRKYSRRGPLHQQVLRSLVPFWSPALPTLPVTTPSYREKQRDSPGAEDLIDGRPRRKQRHTVTIDTGRLLLGVAILACMATVMLLYYRLVEGIGDSGSQISEGTAQ